MSDVFQSQDPLKMANSVEPHHDSPLRRVAAIALVLVVVGGGYYYFSAKFGSPSDAIIEQAKNTLHSSPPEATTSQNDATVTDPSTNTNNSTDSTEYDYQWGPSTTVGYNTFEDFEFGFSVDYPDTWDFDPTVSDGGTVISFSGSEIVEEVSRYGSASIGLMGLPSDMTVDEYDQSSDDSLLEDPSFTYVDRGTQALGAYDGRYIVGTYDFGDGSHSVFLSVVAVNNDIGYTFNGLFDYGDENSFQPVLDRMSAILDGMMASFVVNKAPDFSNYNGSSLDTSVGGVMLNDLFELHSKLEAPRHVRKRS